MSLRSLLALKFYEPKKISYNPTLWSSFLTVFLKEKWRFENYHTSMKNISFNLRTFSGDSVVRICLLCRRPRFSLWVGKIPWRRKWLPTPLFLPGKSHGQWKLAGYSPWGHKELDTTERFYKF